MASICGYQRSDFVARVALLLPRGLSDALKLSEYKGTRDELLCNTNGTVHAEAGLLDEAAVVSGVAPGAEGTAEENLHYTCALHCPRLFKHIRTNL